MVRYSSAPSDFTLTFVNNKKVIHSRIQHSYHGNKYLSKFFFFFLKNINFFFFKKTDYDSLEKFIEYYKEQKKILEVCSGSPYEFLFEDEIKEGGGYQNFDVDQDDSEDDMI